MTQDQTGSEDQPIVVAGHICVDLTPTINSSPRCEPGALMEVGPLSISPGGCVANTGAAVAALGGAVELVADVGNDPLGRILIGSLQRTGADLNGVAIRDDANTSYSVVIDSPGTDRTIWHHRGANDAFDGTFLDERLTSGRCSSPAVVHIGYPSFLPRLVDESGAGPLIHMLEQAHTTEAVTSIDLAAVDPTGPAAQVDWRKVLCDALPLVDVISPSVDDLRSALGGDAPPYDHGGGLVRMARQLCEWGAAVALVSAGAGGMAIVTASQPRLESAGSVLSRSAACWADYELYLPAERGPVIRTTGAGDVATAGLIWAIRQGSGPGDAAATASAAARRHVTGRSVGPGRSLRPRAGPSTAMTTGPSVRHQPDDRSLDGALHNTVSLVGAGAFPHRVGEGPLWQL